MTRKLAISPDVSYMLGIYNCNSSYPNVSLATSSNEMVKRFVRIAIMSLGANPDSIKITKENDITSVSINNSKLKKLLGNALRNRDRTFKFKNEYSASYFAGMFDCKGAADNRGVYIYGMKPYDSIILERIGFHTAASRGRCYVRKGMDFMMFITPFSIKANIINEYMIKTSAGKRS